ncbi:hypothetical protein [Croceibacterium mercuriale]|uniref:hypothetical protein n=1 Tax=Croceibacterium mercuriale TaxID=1572751 RepID=UPI000A42A244|nr:hypothetical protein [Croceibacterium mercuriale]
MNETARPTREERLAAQLRANLRRRKAQGRALAGGTAPEEADAPQDSGGHLSKLAPPR